MTRRAVVVQPGDVLAVSTGNALGARLIRAGEALAGLPSLDNHVVVVHHRAADGTWVGVEGRPGGVGWAPVGAYLARPTTRCNDAQPKSAAQRAAVCAAAQALLGTPYDWSAIAADALHDLGVPDPLVREWRARPAHVVCSSLAAWVYARVGLNHPDLGRERFCQPADWAAFIDRAAWALPGAA